MNRREFMKHTAWGATALCLPPAVAWPARAGTPPEATTSSTILRIVRRSIEVKGRAANVFGLLQANGKPGLSLPGGGNFDVLLSNETAEPTIIHWHGLAPPWEQDGVPNAPLPLLAPRSERAFRFPVGRPGTHWMHAHTLQEQTLLAAPLIVTDPAEQGLDEQEAVILLHDFSFSAPEQLLARLNGSGRRMRPGMMMGMGVDNIAYDAYLANDRTLDDPDIVRVESGGKVRLRIINGAAATAFTIDLGAIEGTLIAVDGQDIVPLKGRRFPVAMGQRLDIRLELPKENEAFPVLALCEGAPDRTGIILAPAHAPIRKMASAGDADGPAVNLNLEQALRAAQSLAAQPPDRRFETTLFGSMGGYSWGLETTPEFIVRERTRVELTMFNHSMMTHPMHLHGHHFQVVAIDGRRLAGAVRDTIHVPMHRSVTVALDADNPGEWAFHCHHLYHMAAGMMASMNYEGLKRTKT